ncbi:hypothetical protein, variant [Exophiala dermatitidis NIH/UT8656]|uniref:Uncharacterized protein n=1 Tax=Exophiala dermatitidis (strain ATCC 34100 / CBS 525.76 / NIH/UT8656) TaxID=858893 RepID=H6BRQ1_EXODN|nr:uncharacterized protein HMPREF1120_02944 [Exophiala dermatitidis NIH/UT8656]XP_009155241.1 hypothetical protein, variant [Exophiala dermatitidis NIH/UT8656]EHY54779.1 hypothetical protein, variant [Exophiala dermatitidis NIH/UT8656]EHY54780.1 hypothetical protein HMPREF1120_02944 [Exophiala dermatitidis NIH/UT8656]
MPSASLSSARSRVCSIRARSASRSANRGSTSPKSCTSFLVLSSSFCMASFSAASALVSFRSWSSCLVSASAFECMIFARDWSSVSMLAPTELSAALNASLASAVRSAGDTAALWGAGDVCDAADMLTTTLSQISHPTLITKLVDLLSPCRITQESQIVFSTAAKTGTSNQCTTSSIWRMKW